MQPISIINQKINCTPTEMKWEITPQIFLDISTENCSLFVQTVVWNGNDSTPDFFELDHILFE